MASLPKRFRSHNESSLLIRQEDSSRQAQANNNADIQNNLNASFSTNNNVSREPIEAFPHGCKRDCWLSDNMATSTVRKMKDFKDVELQPSTQASYTFQPLVAPDETEYKMDHAHRGRLLIFAHHTFQEQLSLPTRKNVMDDAEKLRASFENMKFKVDIFVNFKRQHILSKIAEAVSRDEEYSRNSDCLAVAILTYEADNACFWAADNIYPVRELWASVLAADVTNALANKPLIFIVVSTAATQKAVGSWSLNMNNSDILLIHSAAGNDSEGEGGRGSRFIQELSNKLNDSKPDDLLTSLMTVNKSLSHGHDATHVPWTISTLTKKIYFGEKPPQLDYNEVQIYKQAKALKQFLQERDGCVEEDVIFNGDLILDLVCEWDRLDLKVRDFANKRLTKFCEQNAIRV